MTVAGFAGRSALRALLSVSLVAGLSVLPTSVNLTAAADAASKNKTKVKTTKVTTVTTSSAAGASLNVADSLRSKLNEMTVALAAADAARLSALWTEDGTYTNEDGQQWKRRAAINRRFADVFANQGRLLLDFIPTSTQTLGDSVAISEGYVKLKGTAAGKLETRYSIVFQKQADGWLIASASETPYVGAASRDKLKPLAWLAGDWIVTGADVKDGSTMRVKAEWAANKRFLHLRYLSSKPGQAEVLETHQVIGFDPRVEQIISWSFDASGGFGSAAWMNRGGKWYVDASGVSADGRATRATNIVTPLASDSFTWQSVNRMVDGQPLDDTIQMKLQRAGKN